MAATRSRRRRRRGRFGFLYKLLSVLLILCAVVAGSIVFFRVAEVKVVGEVVYSDEEIVAASSIEQGDNLFLIRRVPIGRKILNQLPYVREVNLRRVFPDTVVISITECAPAAALQGEDDSWWLLDRSCKLLEQGGTELTQSYPAVTGLTALMPAEGGNLAVSVEESGKTDALRQLLGALEDRGMLGQVQSIDLSGMSEIRMAYEGRFSVRLPVYSDDFPKLIHWLEEAAAWLNAGQTGIIDLTGEWARFIPN